MSMLTVTSGPMAGHVVDIDERVIVGRGGDVAIADDQLSIRHFAVQATADGIFIEDLDSTNGTFVGGDRISGVVKISEGSVIRAGQTEFTVQPRATQGTAARPIITGAGDATAARPIITGAGDATAARPIIPKAPEPTVAAVVRVRSGPAAGTSLQLTGPISIGRADADLTIAESVVSRRHAVLRPAPDGGVVIEDLGSTHGTFVDGLQLAGSQTLTRSATVTIGDSEIEIELPESDRTALRRAGTAPPDQRTRLGARVRAADQPPASAIPVAAASSAAPAAVASSPAAPPPRDAPAGPRPGEAGPPKRPPSAISRVARIAVPLVLVAALVLALVSLGKAPSGKKTRPVAFHLRTTTRKEIGTISAIDALQTGPPTGTGAALVTQTVTPPTGHALFASGAATPFTWKLSTFFDTGSVQATITGTATSNPDRSLTYTGTGQIVSGTGTYKRATGTLTLGGTVPAPGSAAAALATQKGANGRGGGINGVAVPKVLPPAVPLTDGGVFTVTGSIRY